MEENPGGSTVHRKIPKCTKHMLTSPKVVGTTETNQSILEMEIHFKRTSCNCIKSI